MNLREGDDYYIERGLFVFTAAYHRKRGYCCGSGCRHCPYWPPHAGGTALAEDGLDVQSRQDTVSSDADPQPPFRHGTASDSER